MMLIVHGSPPPGIGAGHAAWSGSYGSVIEPGDEMQEQADVRSCCKVYAAGRCRQRVSEEENRRFAHFHALLRRLTLVEPGGEPDGVPPGVALPLFLLEQEGNPPWLLLRGVRMLQPVVPVMIECEFTHPLVPGSHRCLHAPRSSMCC